jgi:hypothetical protein
MIHSPGKDMAGGPEKKSLSPPGPKDCTQFT